MGIAQGDGLVNSSELEESAQEFKKDLELAESIVQSISAKNKALIKEVESIETQSSPMDSLRKSQNNNEINATLQKTLLEQNTELRQRLEKEHKKREEKNSNYKSKMIESANNLKNISSELEDVKNANRHMAIDIKKSTESLIRKQKRLEEKDKEIDLLKHQLSKTNQQKLKSDEHIKQLNQAEEKIKKLEMHIQALQADKEKGFLKLKNVDPLVEVCSDIMSKRGGSSFVDISDESNALKFIQKSIQDLDIDNNIMKDENKSQKVTLNSLRQELIKKLSNEHREHKIKFNQLSESLVLAQQKETMLLEE